ncbi:MAG: ABC transporter permease [Bacteroidales bacterium]|nr:ABC transporter permease [Bacteroidales bacterium]MCB9014087.1 ABC transporter permease [Bacteroidales bacterium]
MNFPFYIAKRYLLAKKKRNAINIISGISVGGVMVGTMALVIVLSVFNGFDKVIKSLINSFDPDLKISVIEGKVFDPADAQKSKILEIPGVSMISEVLEENALLKYDKRQYIATMKGVDENFIKTSGIDSMIVDGNYILEKEGHPYTVVGQGVAYSLRIGLNFINPLIIYVPERLGKINMANPTGAFRKFPVFPSGVFGIEQEYDAKYILLPLASVREILNYTSEVSALEIKLADGADEELVQKKIQEILPQNFEVKTRYQQNEMFYRIMKSEKWAIFLILTLILLVASFNIIGSLSMLIIDKQDDIQSLRNLGADSSTIRKIFLFEGWLISITGSFLGILLGTGISLIQEKFEVIKLAGSGSFVLDSYPVDIQVFDILLVWATVILIGFLAALYPVKKLSARY